MRPGGEDFIRARLYLCPRQRVRSQWATERHQARSRRAEYQEQGAPSIIAQAQAQISRTEGGIGRKVDRSRVHTPAARRGVEQPVHPAALQATAEKDARAEDGGQSYGAVAIVKPDQAVALALELADAIAGQA